MVARETLISQALMEMRIPLSPEALPRLVRYAELLEEEALPQGFLGPKEGTRILPRHILESCALLPLLPTDGPVVDVGSGPGLPGLPLACLRDGSAVLVEANHRRADFLRRAIEELGLDVTVLEARAEDAGRSGARESFVAAVGRALAPSAVTLELCLPFVAVGGRLVYLATPATIPGERPSDAHGARSDPSLAPLDRPPMSPGQRRIGDVADVEALRPVSAVLGGGDPELLPLEVPGADARRWAMIVPKVGPTPDRFPRRTGVPARRPLG